jgi:hypothetical protein
VVARLGIAAFQAGLVVDHLGTFVRRWYCFLGDLKLVISYQLINVCPFSVAAIARTLLKYLAVVDIHVLAFNVCAMANWANTATSRYVLFRCQHDSPP